MRKMVEVNVTNGKLEQAEIDAYVQRGIDNNPKQKIKAVNIEVDGDYVNIEYVFHEVPFQRIRRITGYLVGTMDRFNDAKSAEVADRVKHTV